MKKIAIFFFTFLLFVEAADRFVRIGDAVRDAKTGLLWQDSKENMTTRYDLAHAKAYCATLTLLGKKWRLPSKEALLSIVDFNTFDPAAYKAFRFVVSEDYWSGDKGEKGKYSAVYFGSGCTNDFKPSEKHFVRCVSKE